MRSAAGRSNYASGVAVSAMWVAVQTSPELPVIKILEIATMFLVER